VKRLLVLLMGCADLAALPEGDCGNGVRDPGEDCDTLDANDRSCVECRRACGAGIECPEGWTCGPQLLCQHASSRFQSLGSISFAPFIGKSVVADLDGDGTDDLVTAGGNTLAWWRGTPRGFEPSEPLAVRADAIAAGDMDGDGRGELVAEVRSDDRVGLAILDGASGRLQITPRQGFETALAPFAADMSSNVSDHVTLGTIGRGVFGLYNDRGDIRIESLGASCPVTIFHGSAVRPLEPPLRPKVSFARADGGPAITVVPTFSQEGPAIVRSDGDAYCETSTSPVALPPFTSIGSQRVELADMNGDERTDLLFTVFAADRALAVAAGDGEGGFGDAVLYRAPRLLESHQLLIEAFPCLIDTNPWSIPPTLAAGDLDGDQRADLVSPAGIFIDDRLALSPAVAWSAAEIADFNGDGNRDVVAIELGPICDRLEGVVLFLGDGRGNFVQHQLFGPTIAHELAVGDFDGDQIADLAVADGGPFSTRSSVWIFYGDPGRGLEDVRQIDLDQWVESIATLARSDRFYDLLVLTAGGPRWLTTLHGNADRVLDAPIELDAGDLAVGAIDHARGDDILAVPGAGPLWLFSGLPGQRPVPDLTVVPREDTPIGAGVFAVAPGDGSGARGTIIGANEEGLIRFELDAFGEVQNYVSYPFQVDGFYPIAISVMDLDGDDDRDVLVESTASLPGQCVTTFVFLDALRGPLEAPTAVCARRPHAIQADEDPAEELILIDLDETVHLAEWNGSEIELTRDLAASADGSAVGDFDGDGIDDIVVIDEGLTLLRGCANDEPCP
jgi:hypothetical protein